MKHLCFIFSCLVAFAGISSSAQVNVGSVNVGSSSATSVTVTIPVAGQWNFFVGTGGNANADFTNAGGGTCNSTTAYTAGATCTVQVGFSPKAAGVRYGAITLTPAPLSSTPQSVYLKGTGTAPQISFMPGAQVNLTTIPNPQGIAVDGSDDVFIDSAAIPGPGSSNAGTQLVLAPAGNGTYSVKSRSTMPTGVYAWNDQAGNFYFYDSALGVEKNGSPTLTGVGATSLAGDASANLFVIGSGPGLNSNAVYLYTLQPGPLYPIAQTAYVQAGTIGSGFMAPSKVWADGLGNAYVLDSGTLYKETLKAGGGYLQSTIAAGSSPFSTIFVDPSGNLYGYASGSTQLTKETLETDGSFFASSVTVPVSNAANLTFDDAGSLYFSYPLAANYQYGLINMENFASPAALSFASTARGSVSNDSPQIITVTNTGNDPLQFSSLTYPVDFPEATPSSGHCSATTSLPAGDSCTISAKFAPVTTLPNGSNSAALAEKITFTTNTANKPGTQQTIAVSGTETPGNLPAKIATTTTLTVNPSTNLTAGEKVVVTIVVKPVSGTAVPAGTVTLASTTYSSTLTVNLDATGKAVVNAFMPSTGNATLYATYNGSATDATSVSSTFSTVVH